MISSYKTTFMPKSIYSICIYGCYYHEETFFQRFIYDLKCHFYVIEKFCIFSTLRPSDLINTLTFSFFIQLTQQKILFSYYAQCVFFSRQFFGIVLIFLLFIEYERRINYQCNHSSQDYIRMPGSNQNKDKNCS